MTDTNRIGNHIWCCGKWLPIGTLPTVCPRCRVEWRIGWPSGLPMARTTRNR